MLIEDNVLKHFLRNVLFINGTAYAGKSTMCRLLAEKHGLYHCGENYSFEDFRSAATPERQPNMCYQRTDWQAFLNRSPQEYAAWIDGSSREMAGFEVAELIRVSSDRSVIVDTNIPVDALWHIAGYHQVAIMLSPQSMSVDHFFNRDDPDKRFLWEQIEKADDPAKTLANFRACVARINSQEHYDSFVNSGFFTIVRTDPEKDTRAETLAALEAHFRLA
ncbi:hypothetical protein LJC74_02765 [Eubacteriales bacterium OttesenSCG-928-A19]|nr:hypothetical protein [Eubacteriales bacterium OttesenSCG-928-A19]